MVIGPCFPQLHTLAECIRFPNFTSLTIDLAVWVVSIDFCSEETSKEYLSLGGCGEEARAELEKLHPSQCFASMSGSSQPQATITYLPTDPRTPTQVMLSSSQSCLLLFG